jgi:hypothetical protein
MTDAGPTTVRIVHDGGPACMAKVYFNGQQVNNVSEVQIHMDAYDNRPVGVTMTMIGPDLTFDITGELVADPEAAQV